MLLRKNDSGRSIVEMLGVLAIMGVITVMGISGYSQAIGKINRNNVTEDVVRIAQEVRGLFAAKGDYLVGDDEGGTAVNNTVSNDIGSVLDSMKVKLTTPYGGKYKVSSNKVAAGSTNSPGFFITIQEVPSSDCVYFENMAWTDAVDPTSYNDVTFGKAVGTECTGQSGKGTITISYR